MKDWPLNSAIAIMTLVLMPMAVQASDIELAIEDAVPSQDNQINEQTAGLRIDRSNIVSAFHGHLTEYFGDCPGKTWSGSASKDNVRFIDYDQSPAKHLRVELLNLTSGERLKKKYTKEDRGSFDFTVLSLGDLDGLQTIEYTIYNKKTEVVLATGDFQYDLTTSYSSRFRDGEWRWEKFCASDSSDSLKNCKVIGKRERMYCEGSRTSNIRAESFSYLRSRRYNHSHPSRKRYRVSPNYW